jgi:signal transduction histidine kinase
MGEVLLSMNPTLKKTSQEVLIHCDEDLAIVTKPGPINQIMMNLIMNSILHAFKDVDDGTIEITVWLQNERCYIRYQDNGRGIEEKIKQKIFDPFVTTRRGEGGSGLGMHLVYNLVTQALKGQISVSSELGHGAQFDIEFPAELSEAVDD